MNADELLRQWIEAEQSAVTPAAARHHGWERLAEAVAAGNPAMTVPLSTIPVATASLLAEGAAIAVVVGSLGTAAIVATAPATHPGTARHPSAAPSAEQSSRVVVARGAPGSELPALVAPLPSVKSSAPRVPSTPTESSGRTADELPTASPSTTVPSTSTLDEELRLLGRAKREIDRGQPHLAEVWLDEHRSQFPRGMLAAERDGLAVLMTCSGGISAASRIKAEAFLRAYPASPLLDRIRRACQLDREEPK